MANYSSREDGEDVRVVVKYNSNEMAMVVVETCSNKEMVTSPEEVATCSSN